MLKRLHAAAGALAFATILTFWSSTVLSEAFGSIEQVIAVKQAIVTGLWILVPALALAGMSGRRLVRNPRLPLIRAKMRRMQAAAGLGLCVLVPAAIVLARWSAAGNFGAAFVTVQALELAAGATNATLLGLNFRDGLRMNGRLRRST
ncbi:MAG: hypothetical protein ACK5JR_06890 [Tropicimonas sp.]|uniref:hypothetical protein n=1 Tax=Tropicimonas sp. TaxID=2067044 RepID=UPI003A84EB59